MTRFRSSQVFSQIENAIRASLNSYSLNLLRADYRQNSALLWKNVQEYIDSSSYGIAVVEELEDDYVSPNVTFELGYMLAQHKPCLVLKEKRVKNFPADLSGFIYAEFDVANIPASVSESVDMWIRTTTGLGKKQGELLLVYVSRGGTCRCAMAKAITRELLQQQYPNANIRVENYATGAPNLPGASIGASKEMVRMFGRDLLSEHRAMRLSSKVLDEADLILTMTGELQSAVNEMTPKGKNYATKVHIMKPWLGHSGDIEDPWPNEDEGEKHEDEAVSLRYRHCADELYSLIENGLDQIVKTMEH
ncbi:MAG: TIR domain-containing protein [Phototrophicaceae bacterium]